MTAVATRAKPRFGIGNTPPNPKYQEARPLVPHWECTMLEPTFFKDVFPAPDRECARRKAASYFGIPADQVLVRYLSNR